MEDSFTRNIGLFAMDQSRLLLDGQWGIEREAQRVDPSGKLALTPHPAAFGNKLENPYVTTDFSESQIELVTPPFGTVEETWGCLRKLQCAVESELHNELLWPLSMPPVLPDEPDIPIARFDGTQEGREKEIYRSGLALRYGRKMQMISGIHYNFSFGEEMLDYLFAQSGGGRNREAFVNDLYFSMARNFLRYRWLLIYLFGASPDVDASYYPVIDRELKMIARCCPECCDPIEMIEEFSTSLRVSRFGYSDSVRGKFSVSYNSLEDYIGGIRSLLDMRSRKFSKLGLYRGGRQIQLNYNVLQKESEFYSPIRLKQRTKRGETQLEALEKRGVLYAEVRIIDLDPYEKTGISLQQMRFLQLFMLFCLFEGSAPVTADELERINKNHHLAAISGRKPGLQLYEGKNRKVKLGDWGGRILDKIKLLAQLADSADGDGKYGRCVEEEMKKLKALSLLPSARIRKEMQDRVEDFREFGIRKAYEHRTEDIRKSIERYREAERMGNGLENVPEEVCSLNGRVEI